MKRLCGCMSLRIKDMPVSDQAVHCYGRASRRMLWKGEYKDYASPAPFFPDPSIGLTDPKNIFHPIFFFGVLVFPAAV